MIEVMTLLFGLSMFIILGFWPKRGLFSAWRRYRRTSERVLLEDALKHVYHCEDEGKRCSFESLAGALSLTTDRSAELLRRLTTMKLVVSTGEAIRLTPEGKDYALRVIRIHRLWERYLADQTAVDELEWHRKAERQEHLLSSKEADSLAKRLGHPVYDPHGDPIPTVTGAMPASKGKALHAFRPGATVKIVHVEDEPAVIYSQVLRYGLRPGTTARLLERNPESVRIELAGRTCDIPAIVAGNVRGVLLSKSETHYGSRRTLASLSVGSTGVVAGISHACRGLQRRRLLDLGIVPGTVIEAEMESASGDPTSYRIRGASIALRRRQAEMIFLEEEGTP